MTNQYTGITKYYDLLMQAGYYNYRSVAQEALAIVGNGRQVLELGVGTGLLAQQYMELDSTCQFTGIDFTQSMLDIAQQRLGDRVKLIAADALQMQLNEKFDVALSNGGVWLVRSWRDRWELGSHIPGIDDNLRGLKNVANHLQEGGFLLLNLQKPKGNFEKQLPNGIIYSQVIQPGKEASEYNTFQKVYFYKKDGKILAQEQLEVTSFKPIAGQKMLQEAGFKYQGLSQNSCLAIYQKLS